MTRPSVSRSLPLSSRQARDILTGALCLAGSSPHTQQPTTVEREIERKLVSGSVAEGVVAECNTCHVIFEDRVEQVSHYKVDWHRYNLKRRLKGLPPVTQTTFEEEAGDLSSISGSESESDDPDETTPTDSAHQSSPFVYFTSADSSTLYSVYRVTLTGGKEYRSGEGLLPCLHSLSLPRQWVVLMTAGGHFAGAVFNGADVVVHKTFHRYTVRAKRGTAQSVRDSQSGSHGPKSAGATLRRYNEAALEREVHSLLTSWSQHLTTASAIFLRAPKTRRSLFTGGRTPLITRDNPRIRGIPFPTRRPTLKEVKRVHSCLASVYLHGNMSERAVVMETVPVATVPVATVPVATPVEVIETEPGDESVCESGDGVREDGDGVKEGGDGDSGVDGDRPSKEKKRKKPKKKPDKSWKDMSLSPAVCGLLTLCEGGGSEDEVTCLLRDLSLSPLDHSKTTPTTNEAGQSGAESVLNQLYGGVSPLHVASECGHSPVVNVLLAYGADPTIKDSSGCVPYVVAKEKSVRESYRRFMGRWPELYDYRLAQVPSPLTEEMEREKREKATEKKRERKRLARRREEEERGRREEEEVTRRQREASGGLSEREKRALAAEKRLALQNSTDSSVERAGVCSCCGRGLAGLVPFHRLQYHYCSISCVREHRTQLEMTS